MKMKERRRKQALVRMLQASERLGPHDDELESEGELPLRRLGTMKRQMSPQDGLLISLREDKFAELEGWLNDAPSDEVREGLSRLLDVEPPWDVARPLAKREMGDS